MEILQSCTKPSICPCLLLIGPMIHMQYNLHFVFCGKVFSVDITCHVTIFTGNWGYLWNNRCVNEGVIARYHINLWIIVYHTHHKRIVLHVNCHGSRDLSLWSFICWMVCTNHSILYVFSNISYPSYIIQSLPRGRHWGPSQYKDVVLPV